MLCMISRYAGQDKTLPLRMPAGDHQLSPRGMPTDRLGSKLGGTRGQPGEQAMFANPSGIELQLVTRGMDCVVDAHRVSE